MPDFLKEYAPSLAILASGVLIAASIVFVSMYRPAQAVISADALGEGSAVEIREPGESDHWRGEKSAPIVLVEYSDFQCGYCAMIHPSLKRIVGESEGKVAWVYRHFPLDIHPEARPAAAAAECVAEQLGDDGFWEFADTLFNNQGALTGSYYTEVATGLGADATAFSACVASGKYDGLVDVGYGEALAAGGQGTPFTVVVGNGVKVPLDGALPYAQLKAVISAVEARQ